MNRNDPVEELGPLEFLERYGKEETERISEGAGTNYAYFSQIAYGHRRPSVELAEKLVEQSGNRLSFEKLLRAKRVKGEDAANRSRRNKSAASNYTGPDRRIGVEPGQILKDKRRTH